MRRRADETSSDTGSTACPPPAEGTAGVPAAVSAKSTDRNQTIVLICRSGERTIDAGIALEKAGFTNVVNVLDGFEGDRDDNGQRSTESGWRFEGLPWSQS